MILALHRPWRRDSLAVDVRVLWEPRDLWLGVYWTGKDRPLWRVFVCLVPCFPVRVSWFSVPYFAASPPQERAR